MKDNKTLTELLNSLYSKNKPLKKKSKNLLPHPIEAKEEKLNNLLNHTHLILRATLKKNWPKELNSHIDQSISRFLETPKITWKDILSCWTNTYDEEKRSKIKLYFFYAKVYYLSAKLQVEQNNTEKAFIYISHASYLLGFLDGYKNHIDEEKFRRERATEGGNRKESKISKIRDHFSLLLKNPPKNGWGTESETIEAIYTSMKFQSYLSEIQAQETIKDLKNFITEELIHNTCNQETYKALRKKRR
ncbi:MULTISPECIES: hypothetical protein [Pseudomonas]|uniref:Uncharacterized protein n=2 Tax=Pseudomonas TaxID=286 RepID=A0A5C5QEK2_9PSED|nr:MULTISPECIES: hypothetical protein [Pseudomonas]MDD0973203.1 hypothetical protein [Pseudomonas fontis]MDD0989665.1 hypothetical protein [Pseudomonas fontis]TWS03809.1 hypothetical protein FIV36_14845 [Pseudomonas extremaustralis]SDG24572.1 hypothetical protein SAMN05216591_5393 [Pseudomonas extremaustralis]